MSVSRTPAPSRGKKSKPTLHDVALLAGVSARTVSRVVNDVSDVAPATRQRVQDAIDGVGFRINTAAQSLRLGSPQPPLIGLIIEDLTNPFYSMVAAAVEEVARSHEHAVVVGSAGEDLLRERQLVNAFLRRQVRGLILVPTGGDHHYLITDLESGTKIVFLDRPPGGVKADLVLIDDVGGARRAVSYLLDEGHRRIGFVGDPLTLYTAKRRFEGYRRALRDHAVEPCPELERFGPSVVAAAEGARAATVDLLGLERPPTAIFATNNRTCVGVLRAIGKRRSAPAVVCFDDFELADLLATPVISVAYNAAQMGGVAAKLLFGRLNGNASPLRRHIIPTRLVMRS
jgi:LacI family transcriptional regulator, galactose operon repressor